MSDAVTLASATGTRLRGFHSNKRSSTASSAAAMGEANVADMPAAAPATRSVFRSAAVSRKSCATIDPNAPPVMMIGPSAPNGPPDPIEIADESGFKIATRGSTRLPRSRDRFDRFGNAVTANALGAIARHHADDERADDGNEHRPVPEVILRGRDGLDARALEEEDVREERDHPKQRDRDVRRDHADEDRQARDGNDARCGGEIAELFRRTRWGGHGTGDI